MKDDDMTMDRCFELAMRDDLDTGRRLALVMMGYLRPSLLSRVSSDLDDWSPLVRYVLDVDSGYWGLSPGERIQVRAVLDVFDPTLDIEHVTVAELSRLAECPPALQIFLARVGGVWAPNIGMGAPVASKLVEAAGKQQNSPRELLAVEHKPLDMSRFFAAPAESA